MRIICWMGYCDEAGENLYRANATTMHVCTQGLLGAEKHQYVFSGPTAALWLC